MTLDPRERDLFTNSSSSQTITIQVPQTMHNLMDESGYSNIGYPCNFPVQCFSFVFSKWKSLLGETLVMEDHPRKAFMMADQVWEEGHSLTRTGSKSTKSGHSGMWENLGWILYREKRDNKTRVRAIVILFAHSLEPWWDRAGILSRWKSCD